MKVIYIGGCIAERDFEYLRNNETIYIQFAAQKVCTMLLDGLDNSLETPCDVIYGFRVSRYPKFKKVIAFKLPDYQRENGGTGSYVPFCTLLGLCYFSTAWNAFRKLRQWTQKTCKEKERIQLLYSLSTPYLLASFLVYIFYRVPFVAIVPDLPEFGSKKKNFWGTLFRKINSWFIYIMLSKAHGLIVFSKHMMERIPHRKDCVWEVVEGCVPNKNSELKISPPLRSGAGKKVIMYSGVLYEIYGIQTLLDAFSKIEDPNAELWLCGKGDMEKNIKAQAQKDPRIIYWGILDNAEVLALQAQASLLINPRSNRVNFTRYSFPSKNLEYLRSGRPVALMRMEGIPEEYYPYIFTINDDSVDAIYDIFQKVLLKSDVELAEIGKRGREFVLAHKNSSKQGKKIKNVLIKCLEK